MVVHRRAFALILVLVVASATFALAMQGAVAVRSATVEASVMRTRAQAERDAISVAAITLAALTAGAQQRADAFNSSESSASSEPTDLDEFELPEMPPEMRELVRNLMRNENQEEAEDGGAVTSSRSIRRSGGPYATLRGRGLPQRALPMQHAGREYTVTIRDLNGGIDINQAEEAQLVRYFKALGLDSLRASSLAHELLDWRDEDNLPRTRGAELDAYRRANVTPRNGRLQTLEELMFLPSMTRELFERIRPDLTLMGDGAIHAGTASRATFMSAPGMTDATADRIISLRDNGQLTEESLHDALGGLSQDAMDVIRMDPSSMLALVLTPRNGGPAFEIQANISNDRGVQLLGVRMISR